MTGVFNGNQRAFLNYKNQGISGIATYQTYAFSFDMALFKKRWDKGHLGAGIFAFSDKAGVFEMGINQLNLSLSAVVPLNQHHNLSAGLQGGFAQRTFNSSNLKWTDQFKNGEFDPAIASGETSNFNTSAFGDFSAGLAWSYSKDNTNITSNDQFMANAGIAFFHINQPKIEFSSEGGDAKLYAKLVLHGNAYWGFKGTPHCCLQDKTRHKN